MAPMRKQKRKPLQTTARYCQNFHSTLHLPTSSPNSQTTTQTSTRSVNETIEHLRRAQAPKSPSNKGSRDYLPNLHATQLPIRRQAGPPPPRSWLVDSRTPFAADKPRYSATRVSEIDALPGISVPALQSLKHLVLKSMAIKFQEHVQFDHIYLATLSDQLKQQLMSYVACLGAENGVSLAGMKALFAADHNHDGGADITRLDLGRSLGRGLTFKQLQKFWVRGKEAREVENQRRDEIPDAWDEDFDLNKLTISSVLMFPQLTHLSLANPAPNVSWLELLNFSRHLGSITHLSLDGWPCPTLAKLEVVHESTNYTPSNRPRGRDDPKKDEAAHILYLLSKNTPSLEWLSLTHCQSWWTALSPRMTHKNRSCHTTHRRSQARILLEHRSSSNEYNLRGMTRDRIRPWNELKWADNGDSDWMLHTNRDGSNLGPDWSGSWSHLKTVLLSQRYIPSRLDLSQLKSLNELYSSVMKDNAVHAQWLSERRTDLIPEPEHFTVTIGGSLELQDAFEEGIRCREWLRHEQDSYVLAGQINAARKIEGVPKCCFDFGWGREELLKTGYPEATVFAAGF